MPLAWNEKPKIIQFVPLGRVVFYSGLNGLNHCSDYILQLMVSEYVGVESLRILKLIFILFSFSLSCGLSIFILSIFTLIYFTETNSTKGFRSFQHLAKFSFLALPYTDKIAGYAFFNLLIGNHRFYIYFPGLGQYLF